MVAKLCIEMLGLLLMLLRGLFCIGRMSASLKFFIGNASLVVSRMIAIT